MLQPRLAFLALLCVLALGAGSALARIPHARAARGCGPASLVPRRSNIGRIARITLCLINRQRAAYGLRALRYNAALTRAARRHSASMVAQGYFSHDSLDGTSPFERIAQSGYGRACAAGENIAAGVRTMGTPAAIVSSWMSSPGHRANILSAAYRDTGMGVAYGFPGTRAGGATFTQDFGVRC